MVFVHDVSYQQLWLDVDDKQKVYCLTKTIANITIRHNHAHSKMKCGISLLLLMQEVYELVSERAL